jgi:hypothetical protein
MEDNDQILTIYLYPYPHVRININDIYNTPRILSPSGCSFTPRILLPLEKVFYLGVETSCNNLYRTENIWLVTFFRTFRRGRPQQ